MTNRFPGPCAICNAPVPIGGGVWDGKLHHAECEVVAPVVTNSFGNPVKYQNIQQWIGRVNSITHPDGLTMMWKDLMKGNEGHARIHRFMYGTPDHKAAGNAIFRRAEAIGCHYSKVSRIFTWD